MSPVREHRTRPKGGWRVITYVVGEAKQQGEGPELLDIG